MSDEVERTEQSQASSQEQETPIAQIRQLRLRIEELVETQGKRFNPIEHEAVAYEETNAHAEETVTAELQRGYKLHDQVLRPALVKIARAPQSAATGNEAETIRTTD